MTTEARRPARIGGALVLALLAWFGGTVALAAFTPPTHDYWAIGPRGRLLAGLQAAGAFLISEAPAGLILRGEAPGAARALYASGAWLVLPAMRGGCLDLAKGGGKSSLR